MSIIDQIFEIYANNSGKEAPKQSVQIYQSECDFWLLSLNPESPKFLLEQTDVKCFSLFSLVEWQDKLPTKWS